MAMSCCQVGFSMFNCRVNSLFILQRRSWILFRIADTLLTKRLIQKQSDIQSRPVGIFSVRGRELECICGGALT